MASFHGAGARKLRRRLVDVFLNVVFVAWVLHVLVTGNLVPNELLSLLRDEAPVSVVVEPDDSPVAPLEAPGTTLDET